MMILDFQIKIENPELGSGMFSFMCATKKYNNNGNLNHPPHKRLRNLAWDISIYHKGPTIYVSILPPRGSFGKGGWGGGEKDWRIEV